MKWILFAGLIGFAILFGCHKNDSLSNSPPITADCETHNYSTLYVSFGNTSVYHIVSIQRLDSSNLPIGAIQRDSLPFGILYDTVKLYSLSTNSFSKWLIYLAAINVNNYIQDSASYPITATECRSENLGWSGW